MTIGVTGLRKVLNHLPEMKLLKKIVNEYDFSIPICLFRYDLIDIKSETRAQRTLIGVSKKCSFVI